MSADTTSGHEDEPIESTSEAETELHVDDLDADPEEAAKVVGGVKMVGGC